MIESKFSELEFDFGYYTKLEVNLFPQSQIVPVIFLRIMKMMVLQNSKSRYILSF